MKPEYNISQRVYYNLPDGPAGIVIDWRYTASVDRFEYQVSFSAGEASLWYYDIELSKEKVIV